MKPIRDVRRERLALLVAHHGGQSAIATRLGKDKNQVYQWLLTADNKASRNISDTTARAIEAAFELGSGWMDQPVTSDSSSGISPDGPASLAEQASHSALLDDDKLERSIQFLERQFALWDREFIASQNATLITGVYRRIGRRGESNLVELSQWLTQQIEGSADAGPGGIRSAG